MKEEKRILKILFNKSGGSSINGVTNRLTIPTNWIKEMGITIEEREVEVFFDGKEIKIRKKD